MTRLTPGQFDRHIILAAVIGLLVAAAGIYLVEPMTPALCAIAYLAFVVGLLAFFHVLAARSPRIVPPDRAVREDREVAFLDACYELPAFDPEALA